MGVYASAATWPQVLVVLGGLLFGGGGIAAIVTARTQSRSTARRDAVEERRLALETAESTNKILAEALDFYKQECDELRHRLADCEARHG